MKKGIGFLLIILLLGAGGYYLYQSQSGGGLGIPGISRFEIANVVPKEPLVYLELRNTSKNIQRLTNTLFWERLSQIDFDMLLSSNTLSPQEQTLFTLLKSYFEDPESNELFKKFFGRDVAIGVYPVGMDMQALSKGDPRAFAQMMENLIRRFYLVTRLDATAQLAEFVSRSFDEFGEDVKTEEIEYKGKYIILVTMQDVPYTFAYTRIKDLMIMGVGEEAVKKSIDIHAGDDVALSTDPQFIDAKSRFVKQTDLISYTNIQRFMQGFENSFAQVSDFSGADPAQVRMQMDQMLKSMRGFQTLGVSGIWVDFLQTKWDFNFDLAQMEPRLAEFYGSCKDVTNQTMNFMPQNALAYQWGTCFDLQYYWDEIKLELERAAPGKVSVADQIAQYEQMIGLSIEGDIIPAFGDEIGGYLRDVVMTPNFPIPEILLFVKVGDKAKTERLLSFLNNVPMLMLQTENVEGVEYRYLSIPMMSNVSPGYCFLDGYLLISVTKDMLVDAITTSKTGQNRLGQDATFSALRAGSPSKSIGDFYMNVDELAFKTLSIIEWAQGRTDESDQKVTAFKSGAKMKLKQIQRRIEEDEKILVKQQKEAEAMAGQVESLKKRGEDVAARQKVLDRMRTDVQELEADIESRIADAIELQNTIQGYDDNTMALDKRRLYMESVVAPVMDALKAIDGFSSTTTMDKKSIQTRTFLKL